MTDTQLAFTVTMGAFSIGVGVGWAVGAMAETRPRYAWLPLLVFVGIGVFISRYGPTVLS